MRRASWSWRQCTASNSWSCSLMGPSYWAHQVEVDSLVTPDAVAGSNEPVLDVVYGSLQGHLKPRLLVHLAQGRLLHSLSRVWGALGKSPSPPLLGTETADDDLYAIPCYPVHHPAGRNRILYPIASCQRCTPYGGACLLAYSISPVFQRQGQWTFARSIVTLAKLAPLPDRSRGHDLMRGRASRGSWALPDRSGVRLMCHARAVNWTLRMCCWYNGLRASTAGGAS